MDGRVLASASGQDTEHSITSSLPWTILLESRFLQKKIMSSDSKSCPQTLAPLTLSTPLVSFSLVESGRQVEHADR